jgi:hypothetical protein
MLRPVLDAAGQAWGTRIRGAGPLNVTRFDKGLP